ncbi:MAG: hypothetical protein K9N09_11480 [Candidatus Cloacimonetes bacterium]|nr:hypothetical protein [Candidatus Cloacimonadota bacterium]MCF7814900.1 hypothetical protein [Candidatus Cloacimonadota bacterium]MCF7869305.1 hypothetical protein [Candidatus Cloacimonadota bacterium]MCF7884615.1 hypothetical protein [Candidatus Cloacimonadota bacterium]
MRKVILVVSLMIISVILMAISKNVNIVDDEVHLNFDNVKLKTLEFEERNDVEIKYSDKNVVVENDGKNIFISSPLGSKVEVYLPMQKAYIIEKDGVYCWFNKDKLNIETDDGEIFKFENGELMIFDQDSDESVIVNSEGVFVNSDDEKVSISSQGILVEGEDNTNLTGFWGQLLGGFVRLIVRGSLSVIGDSPEKIVKHFVNEENSIVNVDWSEGDDFARSEVNETFNPRKGDILDVFNLNGSVTIESWDQDYVELKAVIKSWKGEDKLDDLKVEINDDKNWQINTIPQTKKVAANCEFEIKIPKFLKLGTVETTNGSIEIENASGDLSLRSSNGSVEVENLEGSIEAFTSNGSIEVENITGKVNVTTSNGRIEVEKVPYLKNVITSNGSIKAEIEEINNDLLLSTSNGSINVFLSPKVNAEVYATTSNSSINVQSLKFSSELMTKSKFEGRLGKGVHKLTASTSNASINFKKLK